jgi:hypothetical protein
MELATEENALFAFDPIKRMVPTTKTRITASMTAYSAISCPESSRQSLCMNSDIVPPKFLHLSPARGKNEMGAPIMPHGIGLVNCGNRVKRAKQSGEQFLVLSLEPAPPFAI